jgi:enoyl-CoA hydratase
VTICRPERRNAVDGPTADALEAAYERWIADDESKVMVLTGSGTEAFCAGADLRNIPSLEQRAGSEAGPLGFTRRIAPKPAIAAVEGWCVAGGLELALWCDLRVVGESARFGCTERRFGVPLIDGGTQRLPRVVGLGRALDLILTGRVIDAVEAERIGLASRVVADGAAIDSAVELGNALTSFPWETLLADRESALDAQGLTLGEGLALEAQRGLPTVSLGADGAERFIGGAGRHGQGVAGTASD